MLSHSAVLRLFRLIGQFTPVFALYDPFGVDVQLKFDIINQNLQITAESFDTFPEYSSLIVLTEVLFWIFEILTRGPRTLVFCLTCSGYNNGNFLQTYIEKS